MRECESIDPISVERPVRKDLSSTISFPVNPRRYAIFQPRRFALVPRPIEPFENVSNMQIPGRDASDFRPGNSVKSKLTDYGQPTVQ